MKTWVRRWVVLGCIAAVVGGGGPAVAEAPAGFDYIAPARRLMRVAVCDRDAGPVPDGVERAVLAPHCRHIDTRLRRYQTRWLAKARPFFQVLVKDTLPQRIVYPFGGADLMTALAVFEDLEEVTAISLELAGDVRAIDRLRGERLKASLALHADYLAKLVAVNHNRTIDLKELKGDPLPSNIVFALYALRAHGFEPVSVRYFEFEEGGGLRYLGAAEIARATERIAARYASDAERRVAAMNRYLANVEVRFRERGNPFAMVRTYRHVYANLGDSHLEKDPRVLRHLRGLGPVTAMTKAASYLLWRDGFRMIRDYLLENMVWMVSESSGISPTHAGPAGFEQVVWGRFDGVLFSAPRDEEQAMVAFWRGQPERPMPFVFGYPDVNDAAHLLVTRRPGR